MKRFVVGALLLMSCVCRCAFSQESIAWQEWSDEAFKQAAAEHKLVLLDLGAVWCHWCHVMEDTTYRDKDVIALLNQHYVALRVDQDARPDLSHRYEEFGWPATIIFAADGTEIVKRRGYVEPDTMKKVLQESFEDPKPNPRQTHNYGPSSARGLSNAQRDRILSTLVYAYDQQNAGWGDGQKFLDPWTMEFALNRANEENWVFAAVSKESLRASYNLIDPVWGGVYQYSDKPDWKSPHFEKILSIQSAYISSYAYAYSIFKDEQYRDAAGKVLRYLDSHMTDAGSAFFTSQDADVSEKLTGHEFYPLSDAERRKLAQPIIDKHIYTSENGNMISALLTLHAMTGDAKALERAQRAMAWIRTHRALAETGGFAHGEQDKGGPFLADTLAMSKAMLDMYAVSGERVWLSRAKEGARFINTHFADKTDGGFFTGVSSSGSPFKPFKQMDENLTATRFFNLLSYYTHDKTFADTAQSSLASITSAEQVKRSSFSPGLLLADAEIKTPPLHLTIVGRKDDPAARALFSAAISVAPLYKQTEWLDHKEGNLPGSDIGFPELPKAAAFVCTENLCSSPIFEAKALTDLIDSM